MSDDGAVVYLNGREIARTGFPAGTTTVTSATLANGTGGPAEGDFLTVPVAPAFLVEGANTLAVELHLAAANSSDLGFELELSGDALALGNGGITFAGDTLVRTRFLSGSVWSPLDEALFLVGNRASDLHASEIMYHPAPPLPGEAEFLELANRGTTTHRLSDLRLTGGIQFDFAAAGLSELTPGQRLVLVRDPAAFAQAWPGVTVDGIYSDALGNGGDTFALEDENGTVLWTVSYLDGDPWPGGADGDGHSLTFAGGEPESPLSWRPSVQTGGTPGATDAVPFTGGDLLAYAVAAFSVQPGADGSPEFQITTRLGADDALVSAEWSRDLETWSTQDLRRVRQTPTGNGLAIDAWILDQPPAPRLFFRAIVNAR
jgi:hypothetical protein